MDRQPSLLKKRSLEGLTILVTRPKESAEVLSSALRAQGANVIEFPTIRFAKPKSFDEVDRAIGRLADNQYDWCIFTSADGVSSFSERLTQLGYAKALMQNAMIAAIGPATARAIEKLGLKVNALPDVYLAEEIARVMGEVRGLRILLPRADIARKSLPEVLRLQGAHADEVVAYRTLRADASHELLQSVKARLVGGEVDAITFTSASTARSFVELMEDAGLSRSGLGRPKIACIGPITAKTARELGLDVAIMTREHTIPGLVRALVEELGTHE